MPKIDVEKTTSGIKAVGDAAGEAAESVADLGDTIVWTGTALDDYIEMLESARASEKWLKEETEDASETIAGLGDTIIWSGEALDFYLEQLEAARRGQEYLNSAIQETIDLGVDQQLVMGMTNKLADDYVHILDEQAKAQKEHEELVGNIKNGMIGMADAIGQSNNAFVDMAKQGLKMVIRSLGEYLLGLAATAIFVDPIKAIAAFVGGMAAIAFSNTLQQGGTIPGGYGGGDSQPTMTEPGEMVITKENVRRNRALLTQINNGTANFVVPVYIGSKLIYKEITKAINETKEIKIRAR